MHPRAGDGQLRCKPASGHGTHLLFLLLPGLRIDGGSSRDDLSKNKAPGALSVWTVLSVSSYHLPTTHAQFIGKICLHVLQNLSRGTERGRSRRWTAAWVPNALLVPDRSLFLRSRCVLAHGYCGRLNHRTQFFTSLWWYYTLTLLQGLLGGLYIPAPSYWAWLCDLLWAMKW